MKFAADRSLWLVALVGCGAAASVACGSDASTPDDMAGSAGTLTAVAGAGSAGVEAGGGGAAALGGAGGAAAGGTAGAPSGGLGGSGEAAGAAGMGGGTGGLGGASGGTGGASGGAAGSAGASTVGPFGVNTCQPAFATACNPAIVFVNGDPTDRGKVFTDAVPDVEKTMKEVSCVACSMLYRTANEIPADKHPTTVRLVLDTHGGVAQAGGGQIQFDLNYISKFGKEHNAADVKQEMLGVLQHETVHLWQYYGNLGTGEGMADLVRTRTGYYNRSRWRAGGSWKDPYTNSAFFYSWLSGPCAFHAEKYSKYDLNLPYKLNIALKGIPRDGDAAFNAVNKLLTDTFGKNADSLWKEFQDTAF